MVHISSGLDTAGARRRDDRVRQIPSRLAKIARSIGSESSSSTLTLVEPASGFDEWPDMVRGSLPDTLI